MEDTSGLLDPVPLQASSHQPPLLSITSSGSSSQSHLSAKKASDTASFIFRTPVLTHTSTSTGLQRVVKKHWTTQSEDEMRWMGQRAGGYRWMHGQCAKTNHKSYNWIGICAIIANGIANALDVPSVVACTETFTVLKIVAIIVGFAVTIVMAFQQFKDYGGLRQQHITSEANWGALYDMIKNEMRKHASDRQNAETYFEWISKQMADLKASSPLIPEKILKSYRVMIEDKNVADPDGIDEIYVNRDRGARSGSGSGVELEEIVIPPDQRDQPRSGFLQRGSNEIPIDRKGSTPSSSETYDPYYQPNRADEIAIERWNSGD